MHVMLPHACLVLTVMINPGIEVLLVWFVHCISHHCKLLHIPVSILGDAQVVIVELVFYS